MQPALLIIDVQQALCSGEHAMFDIDPVVDRINRLIGQGRVAGVPVIFVQHEEDEGPMLYSSAGWQLYERLAVQASDMRIRKTVCDSFHRPDLHALLRAQNVDQLIICGLQSEFCVDSTVRGALAHGYPVVLVADGHSTMDNGVLSAAQISAHHNTTLAGIGGFAHRVTPILAADVRMSAG